MSMMKQLNPDKAPFDVNKKKVHDTKRVYFHAELHIVKVVDEYNNTLAMVENVSMTVKRNANGRSKIGTTSVINARGWNNVYYRYIKDEADLQQWISAVNRHANKQK